MSDWKDALAPTPDCIDVARLGEELTSSERAHLDTCVRCQSELALFREVMQEESSPESEWIAAELRRRNNVVAFRPRAQRVLLAIAAALVLVIGAGIWMQMREPAIDATPGSGIYRGARLEPITPVGDLSHAPNELRWTSVPNATLYRVQIVEVDATVVWRGETAQPRIALPPDVIAQFAPGKSLLWVVEAFRGNESLAVSQTQPFRVLP